MVLASSRAGTVQMLSLHASTPLTAACTVEAAFPTPVYKQPLLLPLGPCRTFAFKNEDVFGFVSAGSENPLDPITVDHSFNDQDSLPSEKSPLLESADVKPSDIALPLPIGSEDHQVLLPIAESQSPPSDTLLRSTITGYSEPQFVFLQQLY